MTTARCALLPLFVVHEVSNACSAIQCPVGVHVLASTETAINILRHVKANIVTQWSTSTSFKLRQRAEGGGGENGRKWDRWTWSARCIYSEQIPAQPPHALMNGQHWTSYWLNHFSSVPFAGPCDRTTHGLTTTAGTESFFERSPLKPIRPSKIQSNTKSRAKPRCSCRQRLSLSRRNRLKKLVLKELYSKSDTESDKSFDYWSSTATNRSIHAATAVAIRQRSR